MHVQYAHQPADRQGQAAFESLGTELGGSLWRAPGTLPAPPGIDAKLVREANGAWTMTFLQSANLLTFRADGLLTSDADRNGNTVAVGYPAGGTAHDNSSGPGAPTREAP